jgi:hypothetical protein
VLPKQKAQLLAINGFRLIETSDSWLSFVFAVLDAAAWNQIDERSARAFGVEFDPRGPGILDCQDEFGGQAEGGGRKAG